MLLQGKVDTAEMSRTFNCGIGFVLVTSSQHLANVLEILHTNGEIDAGVIGSVVKLGIGCILSYSLAFYHTFGRLKIFK